MTPRSSGAGGRPGWTVTSIRRRVPHRITLRAMSRIMQVTTPDGRTLSVHEAGDPAGRAVLGHHGTPAAGPPYAPHSAPAAELGLRLIGYDRPGYGGSDRHHGGTVADA